MGPLRGWLNVRSNAKSWGSLSMKWISNTGNWEDPRLKNISCTNTIWYMPSQHFPPSLFLPSSIISILSSVWKFSFSYIQSLKNQRNSFMMCFAKEKFERHTIKSTIFFFFSKIKFSCKLRTLLNHILGICKII